MLCWPPERPIRRSIGRFAQCLEGSFGVKELKQAQLHRTPSATSKHRRSRSGGGPPRRCVHLRHPPSHPPSSPLRYRATPRKPPERLPRPPSALVSAIDRMALGSRTLPQLRCGSRGGMTLRRIAPSTLQTRPSGKSRELLPL